MASKKRASKQMNGVEQVFVKRKRKEQKQEQEPSAAEKLHRQFDKLCDRADLMGDIMAGKFRRWGRKMRKALSATQGAPKKRVVRKSRAR